MSKSPEPSDQPDPPSLSVEAIDRAAQVAATLGCIRETTSGTYAPLSSMDIHQILTPAFEHHVDGVNQQLRDEASALQVCIKECQAQLDELSAKRFTILGAQAIVREAQELILALADSRVIRISNHYQKFKAIVESHAWNDEDWKVKEVRSP